MTAIEHIVTAVNRVTILIKEVVNVITVDVTVVKNNAVIIVKKVYIL